MVCKKVFSVSKVTVDRDNYMSFRCSSVSVTRVIIPRGHLINVSRMFFEELIFGTCGLLSHSVHYIDYLRVSPSLITDVHCIGFIAFT